MYYFIVNVMVCWFIKACVNQVKGVVVFNYYDLTLIFFNDICVYVVLENESSNNQHS